MNLKFFRAKDYTNFGDELNPYIFNHIFKEQFNNPKFHDYDFYGIGSVIDSRIKESAKAILFGTGIRDISKLYNTTEWDIRYVRGPISANILGVQVAKIIADGAYCLLTTPELLPKVEKKKYSYSLIPHYKQIDKLNWELVEKLTGVHIIDPRKKVQFVLQEIQETEKLLTIAMHGAIIADILRVPWLRIKMEAIGSESPFISDLKWLDFLTPLNLKNEYTHIKTYNPYFKPWSPWFWISYYELIKLIKLSKRSHSFQLSTDEKIKGIKERLATEIQYFKDKYK